jgi:hypothetical protein
MLDAGVCVPLSAGRHYRWHHHSDSYLVECTSLHWNCNQIQSNTCCGQWNGVNKEEVQQREPVELVVTQVQVL